VKRGVVPSTAAVVSLGERASADVPRSLLDSAARIGQAGEAGAVPASVAALASRVTRAMTMTKVKFAAVALGLVLAAGAVTAAVAAGGPEPDAAHAAPPAAPPADPNRPPAPPPAGPADPNATTPDREGKKAEDLKWAKGVASDFLTAAFEGDTKSAAALIDVSLKEAYAKEGERALWEWLNNSIAIQGFRSPTIREEAMSPDGNEASFRGDFRRVQEGQKTRPHTFTLRVVKGKGGDHWRVSHFRFREAEVAK
jgi:hypothetical protein